MVDHQGVPCPPGFSMPECIFDADERHPDKDSRLCTCVPRSPGVGEAGSRGYLLRGWPGPVGGGGARGVYPYGDRDRTLLGRAGSPGLGEVHPHVATHQGGGVKVSCSGAFFLQLVQHETSRSDVLFLASALYCLFLDCSNIEHVEFLPLHTKPKALASSFYVLLTARCVLSKLYLTEERGCSPVGGRKELLA